MSMKLRTLPLALALLLAPLAAQAERYRVEALVFLNPATAEVGRAPQRVALPQVLSLDDANGLRAAGIELQADSATVLANEWNALLLRLAWTQPAPGPAGGAGLRLFAPSGDGISGLDGSLRLSSGRYPHLDADLEYVQTIEGAPQAYRLREKRKMPTATLHYLDSARIGVLARVSRID